MKKLIVSLAVISALGLSGCGSETIEDAKNDAVKNLTTVGSLARVVFDPAKGDLSVPNDILFTGQTDGTLNIPVADKSDFSDPQNALNILDGWSTENPFTLNIDFPAGTSLDGNTVFSPASVRVFEAVMGGSLTDADCTDVERGLACKIVSELVYTQDFITQKSGNSVAVVPLKPLKSATTYILAMTNHLKDDTGRAVVGSVTYELVRQDIATLPLATKSQLGLQAAINSYESSVVSAGVEKDSIIYTMAMTTQSVGVVLNTAKKLLASGLNEDPAQVVIPLPVISVSDAGMTVSEFLIDEGLLDPEDAYLVELHDAVNLSSGTITLPYYSSAPSEDNKTAPLNSPWKARCDSGATLLGLAAINPAAIPEAPVSVNDGFCMAFGLRDLGIDSERNLTKFNPIPAATTSNELAVQMTIPNLVLVNDLRANLPEPLPALEKPEAGWPVVILNHGIPSNKEEMLLVSGGLALQGLATIAIDQPLHGSRGFGPMNASLDPLAYMNFGHLPTLRDNVRQSVADLLGLRFGINFLQGADIDKSRVHFLGQSLGSITGVDFLSLTNTSIAGAPDAVNNMFKVQASTLSVPAQGLAHTFIGSPTYGPVLKATLVLASSEEFLAAVMAAAAQAGITPNGPGWTTLVVQSFGGFWQQLSLEQQASLDATVLKFVFAAQTMLDTVDPINYTKQIVAAQTPIHLIEVVGGLEIDGVINGGDRLIPNTTPTMPLGGTEPLITALGLPAVSETVMEMDNTVSGAVRFVGGDHSSMFWPLPSVTSPDEGVSLRALKEMQNQTANFISSNGHSLPIIDSELVLGN
jgi:Pla-1/cef family extracellular lipase